MATLLVARAETRFDMSRHAAVRLLAIAWFACIPLACGGSSPLAPFDGASDASADAPARDADIVPDRAAAETDAGPLRPFALAATGAQLLVTGPALGLQLTFAKLADDVVAVHFEFWGIPWDAFEANAAPPSAYVASIGNFASRSPRNAIPHRLTSTRPKSTASSRSVARTRDTT
jgi:hypothetical protein